MNQNKYSDAYMQYLKGLVRNYDSSGNKREIEEVQISIDEKDFFTLKKYREKLLNLEVKRLN